jgi:hypothetical protein
MLLAGLGMVESAGDERRSEMSEVGDGLRLVEDKNRTSVGGVPDASAVLLWKCPKCEYAKRADWSEGSDFNDRNASRYRSSTGRDARNPRLS